ncbi:histone deacetylation-related protein [Trichosporon asahii var. asahii CBS 8904]|uniref:Histone deacetylation-related protein n=1 Tax=Trichosporon asahii var. asahii (strain CBS 8904) TaxID=1220162 RepID=K1W827_TRIAC|nr:histone deacetylation-related protein [Trichosporon asahii var. asahii CBS 8904]
MSVTVDTRPPAGVPPQDHRAPNDPTPISSLRSEDVDTETSRRHPTETGYPSTAGPSRQVDMDTTPNGRRDSGTRGSKSSDNSIGDHPLPTIPERPSQARPSAVATSSTYPNTPPHDSPHTTHESAAAPTPSSPPSLPTPAAASPEAQSKQSKSKRKRNATAGPSRQSSAEPERPGHWMGEDNAVIRCICGFTEDDGFTIQCEGCNAWEHGLCFGYQDEASVPDTYFCELCMPRKVDADRARALQAPRIAYTRLVRPQESTEQGKKSRPKTKRQRTERASASERAAAAEDTSNGGNGSSAPTPAEDTSMAPPNNKPKRKAGPSHKPRNASRALNDLKEEDDFFRVVPWEMEYTPIKDNIIRGAPARHAMTQLYREWIDVDENSPPRKGRASYHDSGLPSPTETGALRLSPDMFTSPDFSTLGPPVPPVTLSGTDLSSLSAPTSIRPVDDNHCFLPLKYIEPSSGIYARPTLYGVFVNEAVNAGGFLGEFRGEIIDSASYRKDPINQYSALGIPKPYVHSVGPPVNLMLDARSYGCDNRFVRSGCHPNAVVRPLLFRSTEDQDQKPKLRFGIFASRDLSKNEEIVLGWEWDDQHVVHTLRAVIDSTLKSGASKPPIAPETMDRLALKFDSILTNIFGTFQSCACTVTTDCAFSQMRRLVSGQTFHGVSGSRARKRIDLGELIGAVRGWRRRELEAAEAAKARRFASSGEWELWRTGPAKSPSDDDEVKHDESTPSRPASTADQSDHGMDVDEPAVGDGEPPAVDEPPSEAVAEPTVAAERDDDETEDELPPPAAASAPEPEPEPKLDEPVEPAATTEAVPSADSADSAPAAPAAADAVEEVAPILEEPATADLAEAAMVTEEPPKTDEEPAKPEEALVTGAEGAEPPKDDAMQVDEVEPTAEPPKPEPEVATEQKDERMPPQRYQKPKLRFGIFASRDLSKNEEIVLGWEWDDQHVVHTLRAVIDSTLKSGASKPPIAPETMDRLALKFDSILTNIFGTFQSCACTVTTDCAFSQMRRLVSGQTFHGVSGSRARKRIDLGELIGAVRGWRRRELEVAEAAKARCAHSKESTVNHRHSHRISCHRSNHFRSKLIDINADPVTMAVTGSSSKTPARGTSVRGKGRDKASAIEIPDDSPVEVGSASEEEDEFEEVEIPGAGVATPDGLSSVAGPSTVATPDADGLDTSMMSVEDNNEDFDEDEEEQVISVEIGGETQEEKEKRIALALRK